MTIWNGQLRRKGFVLYYLFSSDDVRNDLKNNSILIVNYYFFDCLLEKMMRLIFFHIISLSYLLVLPFISDTGERLVSCIFYRLSSFYCFFMYKLEHMDKRSHIIMIISEN